MMSESSVQEPFGTFVEEDLEKEMSRMAKGLNDPGRNIDLLSDIAVDARLPLSKILLKAKIRRCDDMEFVIMRYLRLGVSVNRQGRRESVGVLEKVLIGMKETVSSLKTTIREHV